MGASRHSRPAVSVTSFELLYLLKLLYNMLASAVTNTKLIQLYQKSSVWCFASHKIYLWVNSSVATAQPGAVVTVVENTGIDPVTSAQFGLTSEQSDGRIQIGNSFGSGPEVESARRYIESSVGLCWCHWRHCVANAITFPGDGIWAFGRGRSFALTSRC